MDFDRTRCRKLTRDCIRDMLEQTGTPPDHIAALALSQEEGKVIVADPAY